MHWTRRLEKDRLFADDGAEAEFRRGLRAGLQGRIPEGRGGRVAAVSFAGAEPSRIGAALASAWTGAPVLLGSEKWGAWTWDEVARLGGTPLPPGSVVIRTSGGSGWPKFAVHDWQTLESAASQLCDRLGGWPLSARLGLPLHHVSGWMPIVRAAVSGGLLALPGKTGRAGLPGLFCRSEVPTTLFRALSSQEGVEGLKTADIIFGGGAAFEGELMARARAEALPLGLGYGMTETAAMVGLQDPEEFLAGAEPAVRPFGGNRMRIGDGGQIFVSTPQLFRGYWGKDPVHAANRWWATGDLGEEVAPGEIRPIGRIGRQVATGGETVSLEKIERAAAGLAGVRDAWACAVPDAEWGNRILLFLAADRERDWRGKLKERLDPPEVPAEVRMVETVPRSDLGKVDPDRLFG